MIRNDNYFYTQVKVEVVFKHTVKYRNKTDIQYNRKHHVGPVVLSSTASPFFFNAFHSEIQLLDNLITTMWSFFHFETTFWNLLPYSAEICVQSSNTHACADLLMAVGGFPVKLASVHTIYANSLVFGLFVFLKAQETSLMCSWFLVQDRHEKHQNMD